MALMMDLSCPGIDGLFGSLKRLCNVYRIAVLPSRIGIGQEIKGKRWSHQFSLPTHLDRRQELILLMDA